MIRNSTSISDEVLNTRSGRLRTCWSDQDQGSGRQPHPSTRFPKGDCHRKVWREEPPRWTDV